MKAVAIKAPELPARIEPAWLARQRPVETDAALEESLGPCFGVALVVKPNEQPSLSAQSCSRSQRQPDYAGALALFEDACAPAEEETVEASLATLSTLVRRGGAHGDEDLLVSAYVSKLRAYPADIVIFVLNRWADQSQWWPAWKELKEKLDLFAWRRNVVMDALRHEIGKTKGRGA